MDKINNYSITDVFMDYSSAKLKAEELKTLSAELTKKSLELLEIYYSFSVWKGACSYQYKNQLLFLALSAGVEAERVGKMAEAVQEAARTLKEAEKKVCSMKK